MARTTGKPNDTANIGFEAKLLVTADKLRNNMEAAEYNLSDAFEENANNCFSVFLIAIVNGSSSTNLNAKKVLKIEKNNIWLPMFSGCGKVIERRD